MGEPFDLTERFTAVDLAAWRERAKRELGDRDLETLRWRSLDGVAIEALYTESDLPSTRGAPGKERGPALVHEPAGDDLASSAQRAAREGAEALWLSPSACARIPTRTELERFELGLPLYVEPGLRAVAMAGATFSSGLLFDPLGTLAETGIFPIALPRAFDLLLEILGRTDAGVRPLLVSGRPYHEAGAGAVDEVAFALASGLEYLRALSDAGHPLADLPRRMLFSFAMDTDFFVGIAKLRAARLAWSKLLRTLGIDGPEQGMRTHVRSSHRMTSRLDPHMNAVRGTTAAFAAIVGGADSLSIGAHDEISEPSEHGERLARNVQHVLREEGQLARVVDPAGGSYFLEALTDSIARGAWSIVQEIEHLGGMARGITDGSIVERVTIAADATKGALASGARVRVGVNRYVGAHKAPIAPEEGPTRSERAATVPDSGPLLDALIASKASFAALSAAFHKQLVHVQGLRSFREAEPYEKGSEP